MNKVLYNAELNLAEILLYDSSKVIAKTQAELDLKVRKIDPENDSRNYEKLNAIIPDLEEDWKNGEAKTRRKQKYINFF